MSGCWGNFVGFDDPCAWRPTKGASYASTRSKGWLGYFTCSTIRNHCLHLSYTTKAFICRGPWQQWTPCHLFLYPAVSSVLPIVIDRWRRRHRNLIACQTSQKWDQWPFPMTPWMPSVLVWGTKPNSFHNPVPIQREPVVFVTHHVEQSWSSLYPPSIAGPLHTLNCLGTSLLSTYRTLSPK